MKLSATLALFGVLAATALSAADVPFKLVGTGISRTPQAARVQVLRDKRSAYTFLAFLRNRDPKLLALKRGWDWKKNMAVVVHPGLVPTDSKVSVRSLESANGEVQVFVDVERGTSEEQHYPLLVLRVPRSGAGYTLAAASSGE